MLELHPADYDSTPVSKYITSRPAPAPSSVGYMGMDFSSSGTEISAPPAPAPEPVAPPPKAPAPETVDNYYTQYADDYFIKAAPPPAPQAQAPVPEPQAPTPEAYASPAPAGF